jgi:hypothetical protein
MVGRGLGGGEGGRGWQVTGDSTNYRMQIIVPVCKTIFAAILSTEELRDSSSCELFVTVIPAICPQFSSWARTGIEQLLCLQKPGCQNNNKICSGENTLAPRGNTVLSAVALIGQ